MWLPGLSTYVKKWNWEVETVNHPQQRAYSSHKHCVQAPKDNFSSSSSSQFVEPKHPPYCFSGSSHCSDSVADVSVIVSPKDCVCDLLHRFIGSAKISLRDLGSGPVRSLPSKNVPLLSEKQQAVGVNTLSQEQIHCSNIWHQHACYLLRSAGSSGMCSLLWGTIDTRHETV